MRKGEKKNGRIDRGVTLSDMFFDIAAGERESHGGNHGGTFADYFRGWADVR